MMTYTQHQHPFPVVFPRETTEVDEISKQLIQSNHEIHDIYFNNMGFHNHLTHHILIAFAFGADEKQLHAVFKQEAATQRPISPAVYEITTETFGQHLGDRSAYASYLAFFRREVEQHGMLDTINKWVWHGDMLPRTVAGAFHPLLHLGFAVDYNLSNMAIEGLAMAACTEDDLAAFVPEKTTGDPVASPLVDLSAIATFPALFKNNAAIAIVEAIRKDLRFDDIVDPASDFGKRHHDVFVSTKAACIIKDAVTEWLPSDDPETIKAKLKELYIASLALYATGLQPDGKHFAFMLMHVLTSVNSIQALVPKLPPSKAVDLMRVHFAYSLISYVAAGRPPMHHGLIVNYRSPVSAGKGWSDVFARSLTDEVHVGKVVRSAAIGQRLYGENDTDGIWLKVSQATLDKQGFWDYNYISSK